MNYLRLAALGTILALTLAADPLDDLQKLAEQLIRIRQEEQQVKCRWDRTQHVLTLTQKQQDSTIRELKQAQDSISRQLNDINKNLTQTKAQTEKLRAVLNQKQQKLLLHLQQLRTASQNLPPSLAHHAQKQIDSIIALGQNPLNLPKQLQMTQKLHQKIREDARALIRENIRLPHVNAVYQAIFFGASWAIALSPDHTRAAYGQPTPNGWTWHKADTHLNEISAFFQILQDAEPARLVRLPLKLKCTHP